MCFFCQKQLCAKIIFTSLYYWFTVRLLHSFWFETTNIPYPPLHLFFCSVTGLSYNERNDPWVPTQSRLATPVPVSPNRGSVKAQCDWFQLSLRRTISSAVPSHTLFFQYTFNQTSVPQKRTVDCSINGALLYTQNKVSLEMCLSRFG